jgi:hypothetical protein
MRLRTFCSSPLPEAAAKKSSRDVFFFSGAADRSFLSLTLFSAIFLASLSFLTTFKISPGDGQPSSPKI